MRALTKEEEGILAAGEVGMRRFFSKVGLQSVDGTGCMVWRGFIAQHNGYGRWGVAKNNGSARNYNMAAHRVAYTWAYGAIPWGLQIDHRCCNRRCVNPEHLQPVTPKENCRRRVEDQWARGAEKKECPHGHPYDAANTYIYPATGSRYCRTCNRLQASRRAREGTLRRRPIQLALW